MLAEKAMLAKFNASQWTARRHDKSVTVQTIIANKAHADAGRFHKCLISRDEIKLIDNIVGMARNWHYHVTLPWSDDGSRLLPATGFIEYKQQMARFGDRFTAAVENFLARYHTLVEESKERLGNMFNQSDYPMLSDVRRRYLMTTDFSPVPIGQDFRVDIADEEIKVIQASIENRLKQATEDALRDLWKRLYKVINSFHDRLSDSKAIFRDSLIGNIIELTDLLPRLNIMEDPNLDSMCNEVSMSLTNIIPDVLRRDSAMRRDAAQKADIILKKIETFI